MSVHGNLLFMSVEQTRGRLDCGTEGVEAPVSAERFRGVRIFDISDVQQAEAGRGGADLPRLAHAHAGHRSRTTRRTSTSTARAPARSGRRGARGLLGSRSEGRSEHGALQHRRDPGADRGARESADRQPPAHLRRCRHRRDRRPVAGRQSRARARRRRRSTNQCHDITVFPGGRPRGRRLLGQRHPARHLRSGPSGPPRRGHRQELRLLALGDVQQRRHEGDLHRRVGRRHAPALPRDRSADLGRRRHLRHRRSQAAVRRLLQAAGAADRAGELRRAQRLADSGAGPRHHGAGVVSGRRVGVRLHRLRHSRSRSRSSTAVRSTRST